MLTAAAKAIAGIVHNRQKIVPLNVQRTLMEVSTMDRVK